MDFKTKRRVAKKVLGDIQQQVEDIDRQISSERHASRWLLPGAVVTVVLLLLLWLQPDIFRSLSALF